MASKKIALFCFLLREVTKASRSVGFAGTLRAGQFKIYSSFRPF